MWPSDRCSVTLLLLNIGLFMLLDCLHMFIYYFVRIKIKENIFIWQYFTEMCKFNFGVCLSLLYFSVKHMCISINSIFLSMVPIFENVVMWQSFPIFFHENIIGVLSEFHLLRTRMFYVLYKRSWKSCLLHLRKLWLFTLRYYENPVLFQYSGASFFFLF